MTDDKIELLLLLYWIGVRGWLVGGWFLGLQVPRVRIALLLGPVASSTNLFVCIFCILL